METKNERQNINITSAKVEAGTSAKEMVKGLDTSEEAKKALEAAFEKNGIKEPGNGRLVIDVKGDDVSFSLVGILSDKQLAFIAKHAIKGCYKGTSEQNKAMLIETAEEACREAAFEDLAGLISLMCGKGE